MKSNWPSALEASTIPLGYRGGPRCFPVVSNKLYSNCLVLVGSRNGFERDSFTNSFSLCSLSTYLFGKRKFQKESLPILCTSPYPSMSHDLTTCLFISDTLVFVQVKKLVYNPPHVRNKEMPHACPDILMSHIFRYYT